MNPKSFMNPKTHQWTFMKPNLSVKFARRIERITKDNPKVSYTAMALCSDDTGRRYIQGFVQTIEPVNSENLISLFGRAIYTPCFSETDENPILTEILMDRSVRESGDTTKYKKRQEIHSFKEDADTARTNMVKEIQRKQFSFFQSYPQLVIRYLQCPASSPKFGYPESFHRDANQAIENALSEIEEKHPNLFRDHPQSAYRYLIC